MKAVTTLSLLAALAFSVGCTKDQQKSLSEAESLLNSKPATANAMNSRLIILNGDFGPVAQEIARSGGHVIREMDFINGLVANVPSQALKGLQHKFQEISVFEDTVLSLVQPTKKPDKPGNGGGGGDTSPPPQQTPWGISHIQATAANSINRGLGVTVCVVDTGVNDDHPDLAANIVGGRNYVRMKGAVTPSKWNDDNGHGSHVGGTIAALDNSIGTGGVAPEAGLYAVKVLDRRGSGYLSDVTDGIYECINAGTQVINMSLGASGDPDASSPMKTAIEAAVTAGLSVVVAAGNSGANIANYIPAGYSSVIAVSATDSADNFASWSNFGLTSQDYAAPGVSIYSTWKNGGYNTISGTSMAAPHVAGVEALRIASSSQGLVADDLGVSISAQGAGVINALATVLNQ